MSIVISSLHFTPPPSFPLRRSPPRLHERMRTAIARSYKGLEVLYDDGYLLPPSTGDFVDALMDVAPYSKDGGPPRWFCPVDCGPPIENAPLLLYLPGADGFGMGLFMHHKALGRVFEVRCMHIPFHDRTPFEGLLKLVEEVIKHESGRCQSKPIYLLGESFGGCLALAIAARNPDIDLILILANPATSFERSQLQPLFPVLKNWQSSLNLLVPSFFSLNFFNVLKGPFDAIQSGDLLGFDELSESTYSHLLPFLNILDSVPSDTLQWKLDLLESGASYANSHLQEIKAEVLVLASYLDSLMPSKDEAERLQKLLPNCKVHYFIDRGHNLLVEHGVHLLSILKATKSYRCSWKYDRIYDFLPPTRTELDAAVKSTWAFYQAFSPVYFSTKRDGRVVRDLSGVPTEGPIVLVGNHILPGFDQIPIILEFLREKQAIIRQFAHPILFPDMKDSFSQGHDFFDFINLFGGIPSSARSLYRLLEEKSFILLYPGGDRKVLHPKGEEYKLLWPPKPGFVRMCARFGATIVPFGVVGEDDAVDILLDSDNVQSVPFVKEFLEHYKSSMNIRVDEDIYPPLIFPKIPGRLYYLFGRPIKTGGEEMLDKRKASSLYFNIKSEVERIVSYLKNKRQEDAYRGVIPRVLYQAVHGQNAKVPTFEI